MPQTFRDLRSSSSALSCSIICFTVRTLHLQSASRVAFPIACRRIRQTERHATFLRRSRCMTRSLSWSTSRSRCVRLRHFCSCSFALISGPARLAHREFEPVACSISGKDCPSLVGTDVECGLISLLCSQALLSKERDRQSSVCVGGIA